MQKPPTRLGAVGTGLIWSTTHVACLAKLPEDFQVTALCARSESSRQAAGAVFPAAKLYDAYRDLVGDSNVDAVVVCTPISLNAEVTIAALEAGKDVYVEKPLAASTAEADRVIAAETASVGTVYVLEQLLYTDLWEKLREIMASGEIGRVVSWDKVSCGFLDTKVDAWGYGRTSWRVAGDMPLGPIFDGGVHEFALHAQLFGPVETAFAHGQSLRADFGEFDNIQMLLRHENGILGQFTHSAFLGGARNPFTIRGTAGLVSVEGDKLIVEPKLGGSRTETASPEPMHDRMWREFAALRGTGTPPAYSAKVALHDIAALEAVGRSLHGGGEQRVEG